MQSDLSQMEVLPEDIGEPSVPSAEEEPEAPSSEEALAGIELPNLEDLSLPEPMAGAGEEELPPGPLTEEGLPGEERPCRPFLARSRLSRRHQMPP